MFAYPSLCRRPSIFIDPIGNATAAAGIITAATNSNPKSGVSRSDPAFIWLPGNHNAAARVSQNFRQAGKTLVNVDDPLIPELTLPAVARVLQLAQVSALSTRPELHPVILDAVKKIAGNGWIEDEQELQHWTKEQR